MVNLTKRMSKLTELLQLKVGGGAARLPPTVTRLHMEFAEAYDEGHRGSRLFWRHDLRRLKYYNPSVPMTVARTKNPDDAALMTIHFSSPSEATNPESSSTPESVKVDPHAEVERKEVFTIKNRKRHEILEQVMTLTKATAVEPTEEQISQLRDLSERKIKSAKDSALMQKVLEKRKQEARRMAIARGELAVTDT